MTTTTTAFSDRLRQLRQSRSLSQRELAVKYGRSLPALLKQLLESTND